MRTRKQKGFSLIELLIVVAIILIIAAISIPSLLRTRITAHDAAAVKTIQTLVSSQVAYSAAYPAQGYANSLAALGPGNPPVACSVPANVTANSSCLIDGVLGCPSTTGCPKAGYNFFLSNSTAVPPYTDYTVSAGPITWGTSGSANLCSFDGTIRSTKGLATQPTASLTTPESTANCASPTAYVAAQ